MPQFSVRVKNLHKLFNLIYCENKYLSYRKINCSIIRVHRFWKKKKNAICFRKNFALYVKYIFVFSVLKGQSHEIFLLWFFSLICSFWSYQRCPRAFWNFSKFSQIYWTLKTTPRCFGNRGVALKFWGWELCSNINQMYLYSNY